MKHLIKTLLLLLLMYINADLYAEDGYRLWLRYDIVDDASLLEEYKELVHGWMIQGESETLEAARNELHVGLNGLLGPIQSVSSVTEDGILLAGTPKVLKSLPP